MRRAIIIITLLAMMPLAVQSQNYGFYRGSRSATYYGAYNHVNVRSTASRRVGNPAITRGSRIDLGVSSQMSINTDLSGTMSGGTGSSGGSSGISSGVTFGRTGGLSSTTADRQLTSFSSSLPELATTTNSDNLDGSTNQQGFMETPTYTITPIGDAIIPLLLLLIPVVIWKFKK